MVTLTRAQYDALTEKQKGALYFLTDESVVPPSVKDMSVDGTTGAITCTFIGTPTTKSVHAIIGGADIAGSWADNVFTPTTADDILNNANGFVVVVE